jgi:DNA-binding XRE family transcriptional regulator
MLVLMTPTAFASWLEEELAARRSSKSKLAAGIGHPYQTVSAWFNEDRIPQPRMCAKVARFLHLPVVEVMYRAGHIDEADAYPDDSARDPRPGWTMLIADLSPDDQAVVRGFVQSLAEHRASGSPPGPAS